MNWNRSFRDDVLNNRRKMAAKRWITNVTEASRNDCSRRRDEPINFGGFRRLKLVFGTRVWAKVIHLSVVFGEHRRRLDVDDCLAGI